MIHPPAIASMRRKRRARIAISDGSSFSAPISTRLDRRLSLEAAQREDSATSALPDANSDRSTSPNGRWTPKPRPAPRQQNKVLAFALAGFTIFVFTMLMMLVFVFHYAVTHHALPGLTS
jgi:hypothetical protein